MVLLKNWALARPYYGIEDGSVVLTARGPTYPMIGVISKMIERFVLAFAGAFELERTSCGS